MENLRKLDNRLVVSQKSFESNSFKSRAEKQQLNDIDLRIDYLREDLRKHEDEKRLKTRGGDFSDRLYGKNRCPACGGLTKEDALLPEESNIIPMTLEESIEFIKDQIATFAKMKKDVLRVVKGHEARAIELQNIINEIIEKKRAEKELLKTEGESPSVAAIRERLQIENRLNSLEDLTNIFHKMLDKLTEVIQKWKPIIAELSELRSEGLSALDIEKLSKLKEIYHQQLEAYSFSSYKIHDIDIPRDTYRPSVRHRDLAGTSASDAIRSIWAYLLSLLELSNDFNTNHLGFLIFDEPRQQMVKDISYDSLVKEAFKVSKTGKQIIFATSEKMEDLQRELLGTDAKVQSFDERIIKKIDNC